MTRAYRSPSSDNREVLIGAQTSCGAEVLRGAGALAREHSGKGTTSVLEPALSEAEGAEQLPFPRVPNNFPFSLSFRAASAASNLLLTIQFVRVVRTLPVREIPFPTMLGASVPAHAGTDYARTAWCAILSRFVRKGEAIPCGADTPVREIPFPTM